MGAASTPGQRSSAHSPKSRAGSSMQPLASEPGGRRRLFRQSPPPLLPLPLPGSAALEAGAGVDGKGRPAHRPQVTLAGQRGWGRDAASWLSRATPGPSELGPSRVHSRPNKTSGPSRCPALAPAGPRPSRPGRCRRCYVPTCRASGVPRTVPCWAPGQGHLRERALAWESRDVASNRWPLSHCFLNCESRVSNPSPTS